MSSWTHVNGVMSVEIPGVYSNPKRVKEYIEYALAKLKQNGHEITGSEHPCSIFVNTETLPYLWNSDTGNTYSAATLSFTGSLRDRECSQTDEEIKDFVNASRKYFMIDFCNLTMHSDCDKVSHIYSTPHHESVIRDIGSSNVRLNIITEMHEYPKAVYDQLWRIMLKNFERFNRVSDAELNELYDKIVNLDPSQFHKLMTKGMLDRHYDWAFTDRFWKWRDEHGLKPYKELRYIEGN